MAMALGNSVALEPCSQQASERLTKGAFRTLMMKICIDVCIYIYIYVLFIYIYIYIYVNNVYIYINIYIYRHEYLCCLCICIYVCKCVRLVVKPHPSSSPELQGYLYTAKNQPNVPVVMEYDTQAGNSIAKSCQMH